VDDLLSNDYLSAPFPVLQQLRESGPVSQLPGSNTFLVSHYDDLVAVFKDRDTYSSAKATDPFFPVCPEARDILSSGFPRKATFTNCDPPRHPKMREAVARCLTPQRWEKTRPAVREFATGLVDRLATKPVADLVADLMYPLPAFAGFALLGFPAKDTDRLKEWCVYRVLLTYGKLTPDNQVKAAQELTSFWTYVREHVHRSIDHPGDDLTGDLLALSKTLGDDLTLEDVTNMIYSIALAAHETSQNAILNGLLRILSEPDQWKALCEDKSLIPNAVEELLRLETPVMALRRTATRDTTLGGVAIPAGAQMILMPVSGNHDPAHFPDADTMDIRRRNAREHLTFGKQWHFCMGSPLARFEYNLVLELLTTHTPRMRLVPGQELKYLPTMQFRVLEKLLVEPSPAA
jgi:cytochrome P450